MARHLARAIESRGPDATGFGWVTESDWPWYWKMKGRAAQVARNAPLPSGMQNIIVHTRWATKGSPDDNLNNHPVIAPGLVLVHNGVLRNDDELIDLVNHTRLGEVDSEALPALLALGPDALGESDPAQLLELVKGDAAIAWLDGENPGLHLARLQGRPLVIGFTKRGDLIAASTEQALKQASDRSGVTIQGFQHVPEGTYLRVIHGEIVTRSKIKLPVKVFASAARHVSKPKPKPKPQQIAGQGEIDWNNLVPRRGWTVYRNDEPQPGRGRYRYDVASQSWKEID